MRAPGGQGWRAAALALPRGRAEPGRVAFDLAVGAVAVVGRDLGVEIDGLVVLDERIGEVRPLEQRVALVLDLLRTRSRYELRRRWGTAATLISRARPRRK